MKFIFMLCLLGTGSYLLMNEVKQLMSSGLDYFKEIWNYLDFVPPVMIMFFMFFDLTDRFTDDTNLYTEETAASMGM